MNTKEELKAKEVKDLVGAHITFPDGKEGRIAGVTSIGVLVTHPNGSYTWFIFFDKESL